MMPCCRKTMRNRTLIDKLLQSVPVSPGQYGFNKNGIIIFYEATCLRLNGKTYKNLYIKSEHLLYCYINRAAPTVSQFDAPAATDSESRRP